MAIRHSQSGVGHLAALLVVVFLAVAGFAGYYVWNANQKTDTNATASGSQNSDVPAIKSKAGLTATSKFLDQTAAQLDNNLDTSSLDSDIKQML